MALGRLPGTRTGRHQAFRRQFAEVLQQRLRCRLRLGRQRQRLTIEAELELAPLQIHRRRLLAGALAAAETLQGRQRASHDLGLARDARRAHAQRGLDIDRAGVRQQRRFRIAGHAFGEKSQAVGYGGIGSAEPFDGWAQFLRPGAAQRGNLGGEAGQLRAQHRFEAHRLQRGKPAQRPLAIRPARECRLDIHRRRAKGTVARLRPQQRSRRLVQTAVAVLRRQRCQLRRQEDSLGVGVREGACGKREGTAGESLNEARKTHFDVGEPCRRRRMLACRTETVEVAQQRHRRLAAQAVVGVQPGQHPGLEARGVQPPECARRQRSNQVADLGIGLGGDADPVQHALLFFAPEALQTVGNALRRTVRGRGEKQLVEALLEFVGKKLSRRRRGRGHRASPSSRDRR
ncbi:MAG: hypothetical protein IPO57_01275 [Rhodocyclales bacterium]|nr:hypothetical protein [Rhodocyclales bacterium]